MSDVVNILTMKWGTLYSAEYVNKAYGMVARHLKKPFKFVCFTDDALGIRPEVVTHALPPISVRENYDEAGWRKLSMLQAELEGLQGMALFLDLDIVITGDIDCFFDIGNPQDFYIIENWTQMGQGIGNSSVYRFQIGSMSAVQQEYMDNPQKCFKDYDNEQIFLCRSAQYNGIEINYWPDSWCKSFKRHSISRSTIYNWFNEPIIPQDAKIMVFHGYPKPDQAAKGGCHPHKFWRRLKPASWISKHWRE